MVVVRDNYLPDIFHNIIERVSNTFSTRPSDPFNVEFNHGLHEQVVVDKLRNPTNPDILVWLIMPLKIVRTNKLLYGVASPSIIIAKPTDTNYTQAERENQVFFPRLYPVYNEILTQIKGDKNLSNGLTINHEQQILPYWGGGEGNSPGQPNLWKFYVDAIKVNFTDLQIRKTPLC